MNTNGWSILFSYFIQGYKSRIEDVREEILRKRRAGKLPGDTTSLLKAWWQAHSKWPYPTVMTSSSSFFSVEKLFLMDNRSIGISFSEVELI